MEEISGCKTVKEFAPDHAIEVSQLKLQLLDGGAIRLFIQRKKSNDKEQGQAKESALFQQTGRLQME